MLLRAHEARVGEYTNPCHPVVSDGEGQVVACAKGRWVFWHGPLAGAYAAGSLSFIGAAAGLGGYAKWVVIMDGDVL